MCCPCDAKNGVNTNKHIITWYSLDNFRRQQQLTEFWRTVTVLVVADRSQYSNIGSDSPWYWMTSSVPVQGTVDLGHLHVTSRSAPPSLTKLAKANQQ